ncbi:uncharacterized protein LOC131168112 isoform X2 [Malania oleifera]|uniref:uncharacterized protein LOC131168112 isoform X2 n=1 Tax=Malania oleifera TaxID=397392 RepID=UPI0025ADE6BF|nr:uncharacterized protein LOC131168112 isoform X2 [Malania oleifera]
MGASISKWVAFLFFFLSFSLQLGGGAASLAAPQINQDFEESLAARTLKQEQEVGHEIHCSRERSRAARKIIEEYLLPVVEKERYNIPSRCRLRHDNDLYRDQEQHKIHVDINEWQCGYCKKIFYAENYLDQHFDNRHYDLLDVSHDKCLAEVCGALHCDLMMGSKSQKTKCNPAAAARNRHFCESLADNCFPVNEGPSASRLHETHKHNLPFNYHFDTDAGAHVLCLHLFVPEGTEEEHSRSEAHLSSWTEEKILLVGIDFHVLSD